jgi:hypothetical protein
MKRPRAGKFKRECGGEAARREADPIASINYAYKQKTDAAIAASRAAAKAGRDTSAALDTELKAIERNRAAAEKAERDRQKAATSTKRDEETLTSMSVARLAEAERMLGMRLGAAGKRHRHAAALDLAIAHHDVTRVQRRVGNIDRQAVARPVADRVVLGWQHDAVDLAAVPNRVPMRPAPTAAPTPVATRAAAPITKAAVRRVFISDAPRADELDRLQDLGDR